MNPGGESLDESERAALHYLVWPLAAVDAFRSEATLWSRLHARQAALFGFLVTAGYFVLLALPFLAAVIFGSSLGTSGTIWLYGGFFVVDIVAAIAILLCAVRYSLRARRGDLFTIRFVSPMSDRLFARSGDDRDVRR